MIASRMPSLLVLATFVVLVLARSAASAPPPAPPDPTCSPGPSNCSEWHTASVTVTWSAPPAGVAASGCGTVTISNDTGGTAVSCTWSNADGARTTTVNVRKDSTPPGVRPVPERGPDNNGWYNRPVRVDFEGDEGTSGIASCSVATYSGPDSGSAAVSGTCTDGAGNTGRGSLEIKYDASPPSVEASPDRKADRNGWYNRAVTVSFRGTDAVSGVELCSEPVLYKGPDAPKAAVSGTCRDRAANTSAPATLELSYDTTPPVLRRVRAEISKAGVSLRWVASPDSRTFTVLRRPGIKGKKPSTVYNGTGRAFTDKRIRGGSRYRYTVTAYDPAGNGAAKALQVQAPGSVSESARKSRAAVQPALRSPAPGARLAAAPALTWSAVRNATYYNVQLYRNGRKILTAWPAEPAYRLRSTWTSAGFTYRLTPGVYRWYVWPGFGRRAANRYGKLIGSRTFVIRG